MRGAQRIRLAKGIDSTLLEQAVLSWVKEHNNLFLIRQLNCALGHFWLCDNQRYSGFTRIENFEDITSEHKHNESNRG